jgi:hypothetical protein
MIIEIFGPPGLARRLLAICALAACATAAIQSIMCLHCHVERTFG